MPKVWFNDIAFDSELEVEYYKHLLGLYNNGEILRFVYHPAIPIKMTKGNNYTPDFIVEYPEYFDIVETKGYNPYSKMRDDIIHNLMLNKSQYEFKYFLEENGIYSMQKPIKYSKIKFLKVYGFVDWNFKNPNTVSNMRKAKIDEQKVEIKALIDFKKEVERYFRYQVKIEKNVKLTKAQNEWYSDFMAKMREKYGS